MKIYYDTEFLENGKTIELISIGMVREDGAEYYAINSDVFWEGILRHEWLRDNVVPHLPIEQGELDLLHPDVKAKSVIAQEVEAFLLDCLKVEDVGISDELELWSWYAAYDYVALCQLWGRMALLPDFIPQYTNDIRTLLQIFGTPETKVQESNHNALADAHYHKRLYDNIVQHARRKFKIALE